MPPEPSDSETVAQAQIRAIAPESFAKRLSGSNGVIYGASLGALRQPGDLIVGELHLLDLVDGSECAQVSSPAARRALQSSNSTEPGPAEVKRTASLGRRAAIALVHRGECSFASTAAAAELWGADFAVVVDAESGTRTSNEVRSVLLGEDDGAASASSPSAVLVSRYDGQRLAAASPAGEPAMVELSWLSPDLEVAVLDFWMSSGSAESGKFLETFRGSAAALKSSLQFVPHYEIFSVPNDPSGSHEDICNDLNWKYCAAPPDSDSGDAGLVTGADVVDEDVRQLCLWRVTATRDEALPTSANYSRGFWDYVSALSSECPVVGPDVARRFGEQCSFRLMKELSLPVYRVLGCAASHTMEYLDEQLRNPSPPQQLLLNGRGFEGTLDAELVVRELCAGFSQPPPACAELLPGLQPWRPTKARLSAASMPTAPMLAWLFFFVMLCVVLAFFASRRRQTTTVRKAIREEVMSEVLTQMSDYLPVEEPGEHIGRSLAF
mmetsp:Transcript_69255/g.150730  ORF Transcript_69255/g.150730 Transcript_69255/m.150730 type:complete len:495 (-) Transcript_69255:61-1545(-)